MSAAEFEGIVRRMRLPSGALWPIPITLDVSEAFAGGLEAGETIALRDTEGLLVAVLEVGETWRPDRSEEARAVYGTDDDSHAGISHLFKRTHLVRVSGRVAPSSRRRMRKARCGALRCVVLERVAVRHDGDSPGVGAFGRPRAGCAGHGREPVGGGGRRRDCQPAARIATVNREFLQCRPET